eukprot:1468229-Amphidinium_carterae.1
MLTKAPKESIYLQFCADHIREQIYPDLGRSSGGFPYEYERTCRTGKEEKDVSKCKASSQARGVGLPPVRLQSQPLSSN